MVFYSAADCGQMFRGVICCKGTWAIKQIFKNGKTKQYSSETDEAYQPFD